MPNPRLPKTEDFWLWAYARTRVKQVNAAGYRASAVDLRTNGGRSGFVRVFIDKGKHVDLSRLPATERPDIVGAGERREVRQQCVNRCASRNFGKPNRGQLEIASLSF